jgi:molybdate transport system substrate-binding protein
VVALVALVVAVAACGGPNPASPPVRPTQSAAPSGSPTGILRVAAAASLKDVLNAVAPAFRNSHPGVNLSFTFGAEDTMETLATAGGADLLATDDMASAQKVVSAAKAAGPASVVASNQLVIVVPPDNPAHIATPLDLYRAGVRIAALPDTTTIGVATKEMVARLATQPGYPADYVKAIAANSKPLGDDPAALVAALQSHGADAAFVFASDARKVPQLLAVPIPDAAQVSGGLAAVVMATASDPAAATSFVSYLRDGGPQATLRQYGFGPPGAP